MASDRPAVVSPGHHDGDDGSRQGVGVGEKIPQLSLKTQLGADSQTEPS